MKGQGAHSFVVEPAGRCRACGSNWGAAGGCCVICACPTVERQLAMAPQRGRAFGLVLKTRDRGADGRMGKRNRVW